MENPLDEDDKDSVGKRPGLNDLIIDPRKTIYIRSFSNTSAYSGSFAASGQDDSRVLEDIQPRWVIMHDADLSFIRRLEVCIYN
jgi:hypothetical protein